MKKIIKKENNIKKKEKKHPKEKIYKSKTNKNFLEK